MKVCIVGHHKNAEGANLGSKVNSCDAVVRMKSGYRLCTENPSDYGTRTDYLCTSTETLPLLKPIGCKEYWGYPKNGFFDEDAVSNSQKSLDAKLFVDLNGSNLWNHLFRSIGGRHPNVTLGMACIFISARRLKPKEILLLGMDTILKPELGIDRITTVSRTGVGEFPDHDWETEHKLLKHIEQAYKLKICSL